MTSSSDQKGPEPTSPKRRNPAAHLAAHRFQPGQSGNPGGRPKARSITTVLRERLDEAIAGDKDVRAAVERLVEAVLKQAIAGDLKALALLLERTEGPPPAKGDEAARGGAVNNPVVIYLPHNARDEPGAERANSASVESTKNP
jgi:hypothetical protein